MGVSRLYCPLSQKLQAGDRGHLTVSGLRCPLSWKVRAGDQGHLPLSGLCCPLSWQLQAGDQGHLPVSGLCCPLNRKVQVGDWGHLPPQVVFKAPAARPASPCEFQKGAYRLAHFLLHEPTTEGLDLWGAQTLSWILASV